MRTLLVGGGLILMAAASSASAGIDGVVTGRTITYNIGSDGTPNPGPFKVDNSATQLSADVGSFSNYQVSAVISPIDIAFGTNATAAGGYAYQSAATSVKVTFTNSGASAVDPVLHSSIIPGGFGFYTGDTSGFTGDINATPGSTATFDQLSSRYSSRFAESTFNFTVSSGGKVLTSYTGDAYLDCGTTDFSQACMPAVGHTLGGQSPILTNFAQVTPTDSGSAYAFAWDQTDFAVSLGGELRPGQSRSFTYTTEVTAATDFTDGPNNTTLVAYSGFGDPIGKGGTGGGNALANVQPASIFDAPQSAGGIEGLDFSRFSIGLPTFNSQTGELDLPIGNPAPNLPLTDRIDLVPEPGAWALILSGFFALGAVLRRTRRAPAFA